MPMPLGSHMLRIIVASAIAFVTAMSAPIGSASAQSFGSSYTPGAVCHVAYVDVLANPNPNELARKAADAA